MLFVKQSADVRRSRNMTRIIFLPLMIAIILSVSACSAPKGSILILENQNGAGFTMDFKEWSSKDKCDLSLNKGDVLQIEVVREDGEIVFAVSGKNGSEPYAGNDLQSGVFTVTVSDKDDYSFKITGKDATGKITVKNLGSKAE